eukprot:GGOE01014178.1.p1 GENE.GGOE01014178.1~~GGOE01014178.1.p1  ORF type:complete len:174 (+),score=29.17 GGOE01014178.1:55-576(+)
MENVAPAHFSWPAPLTPHSKAPPTAHTPRRVFGDITNCAATPGKVDAFCRTQPKTPKTCTPRRPLSTITNSHSKKQKVTDPPKPCKTLAGEPRAAAEEAALSSDESDIDYMHPSDTPSPRPCFVDGRGNEVCIDLKEFPFPIPPPVPTFEVFSDHGEDFIPMLDLSIPGLEGC